MKKIQQGVQPIKSKYSHCPACRVEFHYLNSNEPSIRAIFTECISKPIPDLINFEFECRRCYFKWNEATEQIKPIVTQTNSTFSQNKIADGFDGGLNGYIGTK
jgi:hypothetical protein